MWKRVALPLCLTAGVLAAVGTGLHQNAVADDGVIRIGVLTPQSPPGSIAQGSEARAGFDLAAKMLNEAGGVLGKKIEMIQADTRGVPEDGRAAAERLIANDKVDVIVGGIHSSVCLAIIDVLEKYQKPFMNVNCWTDDLRTQHSPLIWNVSVNNSTVSEGGATFIKSLNRKKVVALVENTDYGLGLVDKLKAALAEKAPDISFSHEVVDRESRDYTPTISKLKEDQPDLVVTMMDCPGGCIMINQLYQQGVAPSAKTWLFDLASVAELPDFWDNVHDAGKYVLAFALSNPKMQVSELGQKVRDRYVKENQKEPSRLVYQGFDALWSLADGIKRAGGTDADKLDAALRDTKLPGTRGTISFSSDEGPFFQQWVDIPYAVTQFTAPNQSLEDAPIVFPEAQATGKIVAPE